MYLSCMGLCLNSKCPLGDEVLLYNSCPAQYPDRIHTLANNSYLTFVTESEPWEKRAGSEVRAGIFPVPEQDMCSISAGHLN